MLPCFLKFSQEEHLKTIDSFGLFCIINRTSEPKKKELYFDKLCIRTMVFSHILVYVQETIYLAEVNKGQEKNHESLFDGC